MTAVHEYYNDYVIKYNKMLDRLFYKTFMFKNEFRKWSGRQIFRKGRVGKIISILFTFQYLSKISIKFYICLS